MRAWVSRCGVARAEGQQRQSLKGIYNQHVGGGGRGGCGVDGDGNVAVWRAGGGLRDKRGGGRREAPSLLWRMMTGGLCPRYRHDSPVKKVSGALILLSVGRFG